MKFKVIFWLFNTVIVFSFLLVAFLPAFVVGTEYALVFWGENWPIVVLFLAVLLALNGYFISNWPLFTRLESQDWEGLSKFLEKQIYEKAKLSAQNVRILINTYVVLAQPERIAELEKFLRERKTRLLRRLVLQFGVAHLLSGDPDRIIPYFDEMRGSVSGNRKEWCDWNYAFGLALKQRTSEAREVLIELTRRTSNYLIQAVSLYILHSGPEEDEQLSRTVSEGREALRSRFSHAKWKKYVDKYRGDLQVLAISKIIEEAGNWLFDEPDSHAGTE